MKLIDADAVLACINTDIADFPVDSDYARGRRYFATYIRDNINNGDFDPPKFSAEAVGLLKKDLGTLKTEFYKEYRDLCDHLIEYLEQLRESK